MSALPLKNKRILVTGSARRVGKIFALACARAGADVIVHHGHSDADAENVRDEIEKLGRKVWIFKADLSDSYQAQNLIPKILESTPLHGLVNSAAIFERLSLEQTAAKDWEKHIAINLTAPFLLSQAFASQAKAGGRIKNVPMKRWAHEDEIERALIFLLTSPEYVTGEIIHVDGGRHLV